MANITKIRIRKNEGEIEVLVLIEHPMVRGHRTANPSGDSIGPNYVETMIFSVNGARVAELGSGPGLATNPFAAIRLPDASPGDTVSVRWVDTRGEIGGAKATVE